MTEPSGVYFIPGLVVLGLTTGVMAVGITITAFRKPGPTPPLVERLMDISLLGYLIGGALLLAPIAVAMVRGFR